MSCWDNITRLRDEKEKKAELLEGKTNKARMGEVEPSMKYRCRVSLEKTQQCNQPKFTVTAMDLPQ